MIAKLHQTVDAVLFFIPPTRYLSEYPPNQTLLTHPSYLHQIADAAPRVGQNHIHIQRIYGIFGREIT
jgi:hypothetical protein